MIIPFFMHALRQNETPLQEIKVAFCLGVAWYLKNYLYFCSLKINYFRI
jgi:hypothetical protein